MLKRKLVLFVGLAFLLSAAPVHAWDETGHRVIAYIAWQQMTPETRADVMEILMQAPWRSDLLDLFPRDGRPLEVRRMEYFLAASTWPDIVRDRNVPERYEKYHHGPWHYVYYYWEEEPDGPRERADLETAPVNIIERLAYLVGVATNDFFVDAQRAVALAWIEHLAGDIHQPLHTSARVTAAEPEGDQGGNLFTLDGESTLHGYWDSIIDAGYPFQAEEDELARIQRIGQYLLETYPPSAFDEPLQGDDYEGWALRSLRIAQAEVYEGVERGEYPSPVYAEKAQAIAEQAAALAGYRLGNLLNEMFD